MQTSLQTHSNDTIKLRIKLAKKVKKSTNSTKNWGNIIKNNNG